MLQKFLIMTNLRHDMLLGMDLRRLDFEIRLNNQPLVNYGSAPTAGICTIEGGLAHLTTGEHRALEQFLESEVNKFDHIQGVIPLIQHRIQLEDTTPIKQKCRPRNPAMQRIIDEEVDKMLAEGVIRPSSSPWSSPVVIVRKKDGKLRFCVDFRRLNKVSKKDAYPLPQINATLDKLRGARYLSTIDLKNGYWQIPLTPESQPLTAFTVAGKGLFEFTVMPFGLHSGHIPTTARPDNHTGTGAERLRISGQHCRRISYVYRTPQIAGRSFPSTAKC